MKVVGKLLLEEKEKEDYYGETRVKRKGGNRE